MERLNEIMLRTTPRRQHNGEQNPLARAPLSQEQMQRQPRPSHRLTEEQYLAYPTQRTQYRVTDEENIVPPMRQRFNHAMPADPYSSATQVDVINEWNDEADSVDMHYGDWENSNNGDNLQQEYPRAGTMGMHQRMNDSSTIDDPLATQSLPAMPRLDSQEGYATRKIPAVRPPRAQGYGQPPAPQALPQEIKQPMIQTQPLSPRSLTQRRQQGISSSQRSLDSLVVSSQIVVPSVGNCSLCKGAGFLRANVPYSHPNFGKPIACECKEAERKEKRRQQLRDISKLGGLQHASFKNFNPNVSVATRRAFEVAYAYAQNPDSWLLFIGRNGCGKTHLAAAIANQHLSRGSLVLFTVVTELLAHLRATFRPDSSEVYDQLFTRMCEAELLILDDLGAQQSSPWANEKLFQLLNYRYNSHFPTVITTNNISLQGIEERIRSRLTDASLVTTVTFEGALDYRPRNPRKW